MTPIIHSLNRPNPRVGILAKINEQGKIDICDRWAKPFVNNGFDVIYIPVGTEDLDDVIANIDGLLLPGGDANIDPSYYDPDFDENNYHFARDKERDKTAIALIKKIAKTKIPTLAICRGMQEVVVTFGGVLRPTPDELYLHSQNLDARQDDGSICLKLLDRSVHPISAVEATFMHDLFGGDEIMINSAHYECTHVVDWKTRCNKTLRDNFKVAATAPDGTIEAIEGKWRPIYAVQGHFETDGPLHDKLFGMFYDKIDEYFENKSQARQDYTLDVKAIAL